MSKVCKRCNGTGISPNANASSCMICVGTGTADNPSLPLSLIPKSELILKYKALQRCLKEYNEAIPGRVKVYTHLKKQVKDLNTLNIAETSSAIYWRYEYNAYHRKYTKQVAYLNRLISGLKDTITLQEHALSDLRKHKTLNNIDLVNERDKYKDRCISLEKSNRSLNPKYERVISELRIKLRSTKARLDDSNYEFSLIAKTNTNLIALVRDKNQTIKDKDKIIDGMKEFVETLSRI